MGSLSAGGAIDLGCSAVVGGHGQVEARCLVADACVADEGSLWLGLVGPGLEVEAKHGDANCCWDTFSPSVVGVTGAGVTAWHGVVAAHLSVQQKLLLFLLRPRKMCFPTREVVYFNHVL